MKMLTQKQLQDAARHLKAETHTCEKYYQCELSGTDECIEGKDFCERCDNKSHVENCCYSED
jgi:hypothetical protein